MFTTKYAPRSVDEFAGNANAVLALQRWLFQTRTKPVALLCGPTGSGKTCLAKLLLFSLPLLSQQINVFEVTLDERDSGAIRRFIQPTTQVPMDCYGIRNVLFVDDLDVGDTLPLALFKQTKVPILAICQDSYALKSLLPYAEVFRLVPPTFEESYPLLYRVVTAEGMQTSLKRLQKWHEDARGDLRFLLNMMQVNLSPDKRMPTTTSSNVFDSTTQLLQLDLTLEEKEPWYHLYPELHPGMIHENMPRCVLGQPGPPQLRHLAASADALSDADMFGRVLPDAEGVAVLAACSHGCKRGKLHFCSAKHSHGGRRILSSSLHVLRHDKR